MKKKRVFGLDIFRNLVDFEQSNQAIHWLRRDMATDPRARPNEVLHPFHMYFVADSTPKEKYVWKTTSREFKLDAKIRPSPTLAIKPIRVHKLFTFFSIVIGEITCFCGFAKATWTCYWLLWEDYFSTAIIWVFDPNHPNPTCSGKKTRSESSKNYQRLKIAEPCFKMTRSPKI